MKGLNEALTFFLELAMLVFIPLALIHWTEGLLWKILFPVAADAVIIAAWYLWLAPRGPRRLSMVLGLIIATLLLLLGPAAAFAMGEPGWGGGLAGVLILNRVLAIAWKQW